MWNQPQLAKLPPNNRLFLRRNAGISDTIDIYRHAPILSDAQAKKKQAGISLLVHLAALALTLVLALNLTPRAAYICVSLTIATLCSEVAFSPVQLLLYF